MLFLEQSHSPPPVPSDVPNSSVPNRRWPFYPYDTTGSVAVSSFFVHKSRKICLFCRSRKAKLRRHFERARFAPSPKGLMAMLLRHLHEVLGVFTCPNK